MTLVRYVSISPCVIDDKDALSRLEINVNAVICALGEEDIISVQHLITPINHIDGRRELLYTAQILYNKII